ncbi:MAG: hypothetical protein WD045_08900 [Pirellulaceae bacterium]
MELGIDLLLRWGHILPAVLLAGGTWYMVLALRPAVSEMEEAQQAAFKDSLRRRWSKVVMACSGLLLLSGLVVLVKMAMTFEFPQGYYHAVGGLKFLLALVVFFIASLLTGKSENAQKFRESEGKWLKLNAVLALTIVLMGGLLRVADRTPKSADGDETSRAIPTSIVENVSPEA